MGTAVTTGTFYGVGVGPGDPELVTQKAIRLIRHCEVLAYIRNAQGDSMALDIVKEIVGDRQGGRFSEYPIVMPMCDHRDTANRIYDEAAQAISHYLAQSKDVVFVCEGDPFFFGSFANLHDRLVDKYAVEVVPGVNSINAGSAMIGRPLGRLAENIAILSGRHQDEAILSALNTFDNVAIMKAGRRRRQILQLIAQSGRIKQGCYIEYVGHDKQRVVRDLTQLDDKPGPYFSLFLIYPKRTDEDEGRVPLA